MEPRALVILGGALLGMALYQMYRDSTAVTAGDENSDVIEDTYDDMKNMLTGWPSGSAPYQDTITAAAQAYSVPVSILAWLLWKESRYNPAIINGSIKSRVGATGIAQFMPATAADLGVNPLNASDSIYGAARYLSSLYSKTGTWAEALAAYNWGIGNVTRKGIGAAPAETRDYYATILSKAGYEATA